MIARDCTLTCRKWHITCHAAGEYTSVHVSDPCLGTLKSANYFKKLYDFATSDAVHCLVYKIMLGKQPSMWRQSIHITSTNTGLVPAK